MKYKQDLRDELQNHKKKREAAELELSKFKWVDINEKTPLYEQFVNVCGGDVDGVSSGFYQPDYGYNSFEVIYDDERQLLGCTHWMQLPEAIKL